MLKFKNKTPLIVLTCLIAASFSIGSFLTDDAGDLNFSNENIGWVGMKPIKNIDFLRYKEFLSSKQPDIKNEEVVEKIGERYAILQYAENELNIKILNKKIIEKIKKDKMFHSNGQFDEKIYLSHLKEINLTPLAYETNVRENLVLEEVIKLTDIRNNSKKSAKLLSDSLFQVLDIDLYEMNYQFQDKQKSNDIEMKDFYNKNKNFFFTPLTYQVEVSKFQKTNSYLKNELKKFKESPEKIYDIRQILVNTKTDLEKINLLIEKEPFETLAKKYSVDSSSSSFGGLIKGLKISELTPDFVSGLEKSSIGGVFVAKSSLGYHIVKKISVLDENITLEDFKSNFEEKIDLDFRSNIENSKIEPISKEEISVFAETFSQLVEGMQTKVGSTSIVGTGNVLEKVEIIKEEPTRLLDINSEDDLKLIKVVYQNKLKLANAIKISENIDKIYKKENFPWIMMNNMEINKNTNIPEDLKDVIYKTKIGEKGNLLYGNKFFSFVVNKEKSFKTKDAEFAKVISSIYNFESGSILIKEAKNLYPIRISKKIVTK